MKRIFGILILLLVLGSGCVTNPNTEYEMITDYCVNELDGVLGNQVTYFESGKRYSGSYCLSKVSSYEYDTVILVIDKSNNKFTIKEIYK